MVCARDLEHWAWIVPAKGTEEESVSPAGCRRGRLRCAHVLVGIQSSRVLHLICMPMLSRPCLDKGAARMGPPAQWAAAVFLVVGHAALTPRHQNVSETYENARFSPAYSRNRCLSLVIFAIVHQHACLHICIVSFLFLST